MNQIQTPDIPNAIAAIEAEIVRLKVDVKNYEQARLPVPEHLARRLENLKGAAVALRKQPRRNTQGENR